jgi:hypothetical protein
MTEVSKKEQHNNPCCMHSNMGHCVHTMTTTAPTLPSCHSARCKANKEAANPHTVH